MTKGIFVISCTLSAYISPFVIEYATYVHRMYIFTRRLHNLHNKHI